MSTSEPPAADKADKADKASAPSTSSTTSKTTTKTTSSKTTGTKTAAPSAGAAKISAAMAKAYADPALYIYTSLTAGSSHIVTATSRLETILRANRVPFKAVDLATDDKARSLWARRALKDPSGRARKLPGLVQGGFVVGDLVEIEEWNEYGELKEHVTIYYDEFTQPPKGKETKIAPIVRRNPATPVDASSSSGKPAPAKIPHPPAAPPPMPQKPKTASEKVAAIAEAAGTVQLPIRSIAEEAAQKAKQVKLQSLREKVHGKGATASAAGAKAGTGSAKSAAESKKDAVPAVKKEAEKKEEEEEEDDDEEDEEEDDEEEEEEKEQTKGKAPATSKPSIARAATTTPAGLQSPSTGAWKDGGSGSKAAQPLASVVQSPTTTTWKPTDVDEPVTSFEGAVVESASAEEIAAVEKAEAIEEEDDEDDDDEDDDDEEEDEEEDEDEKKK